ncbi:Subtilisin-like protease, fibronectin type-III domain [Dillenia turbinata]|uniref:Subtilisin-like protease, fibronectin type-III domain n=1 Tax=Dillenia turbinata TaxID=194707 RepID=A0AAN8VJ88_9MAGN
MQFTLRSVSFFSIFIFSLLHVPTHAIKKSYIVYLGEHSHDSEVPSADLDQVTNSHYQFLSSFLQNSNERPEDVIFYSYTRNINGFAAILDEEQAAEIAKHPKVVSVLPNLGRKLHTTHSWELMGLERYGNAPSQSLWKKANFGEDIIIANLDTGVFPESKSFDDEGMGPVPSKWKGICQNGNKEDEIHCNSLSDKGLPRQKFYPLISAADTKAGNVSSEDALLCKAGTLDPKLVKGKILVCRRGGNARVEKGQQAALAGAVAMILVNDELSGNEVVADPHILPASHISYADGLDLFSYLKSTKTRDNTDLPMITAAKDEATPFSYGGGHVRPNRAVDPGLVYDLIPTDYIKFLCGLGYNQTQIDLFTKGSFCPKSFKITDLNYPSITVPSLSGTVTVSRTLKNVGSPGTYHGSVKSPPGISVELQPKSLKFEKIGEEKSFKLLLKAKGSDVAKEYVFGHLLWSDGTHNVRSPIVVKSS